MSAPRPAPLSARLLSPLLALVLSACAPLVRMPGPRTGEPFLGQAHFVTADGAVLPVRRWLPEEGQARAVMVAVHGFNDYSHAFAMPGRYFRTHGIALYAYDQRGFGNAPSRGLWWGTETYVADLADFTRKVRERHPGLPVYILGESMGGALAIVAMTSKRPPPADGVILSAPAVWGRATMPWYQRVLLAMLSHTVPWMTFTGEGLHIRASDNIEMLRGLGRDPRVIKATRVDAMHGLTDLMDQALRRAARLHAATLVLYGEKDQVVPREPVRRMLDELPRSPSSRVAYYEKGYHMLLRDLSAEKPWADIAAWIEDGDRPLPSGAENRAARLAQSNR